MQMIYCGTTAFTSLTKLEPISQEGVLVEVQDLYGAAVEGSLVLREAETTKEITYSITDGKCLIPSAALQPSYKYAISICVGAQRASAGYVDVLKEALLGKCLFPVRDDKNHIWTVCAALIELLRETRDKLDNHVDGTEVI